MALRVYFRDQNPTVDHFAYKQSNARAAAIIANGEGELIMLPDGRAAIQLYRRQAGREQWIERFEKVKNSNSSSPFAPVKYVPSPTCGCAGAAHRACGRTIEREEKPLPPTPEEIAAFMQSRELATC